ncbi:hypothetical protein AURDEDRAFT_164281 [Auricularia subglabra TFB-10046 SS5]|nr:hypothetical protein AURDEDRAFT_164281 [Auricularia subglabra TFB-10046 SS5]
MSDDFVFVEDDDDSKLSCSPPDAWEAAHGEGYEMFHGSSIHKTQAGAARVTFTFTGSYVEYYSDLNFDHDDFLVSVDVTAPQTASSYAPTWTNASRLLFASPLDPGSHVLTITNVKDKAWIGLDYFKFVPSLAP